jgi:hypothetical protein
VEGNNKANKVKVGDTIREIRGTTSRGTTRVLRIRGIINLLHRKGRISRTVRVNHLLLQDKRLPDKRVNIRIVLPQGLVSRIRGTPTKATTRATTKAPLIKDTTKVAKGTIKVTIKAMVVPGDTVPIP